MNTKTNFADNSADDNDDDQDSLGYTPGVTEETTITSAHQDALGNLHWTTVSSEVVLANPDLLRQAALAYYAVLGHELLHMQAHTESSRLVVGERVCPRLLLIQGGA